mgnify:CR=1 FL=1
MDGSQTKAEPFDFQALVRAKQREVDADRKLWGQVPEPRSTRDPDLLDDDEPLEIFDVLPNLRRGR